VVAAQVAGGHWVRKLVRLVGPSLLTVATLAAPSRAAQEKWTQEKAQAVLANRDWVACSPELQRLEEHWATLSDSEREDHRQSAIEDIERAALLYLIDANLAPEAGSALLADCLDHPSREIRRLAVYNSIRQDYGGRIPALYEVLSTWSLMDLRNALDTQSCTGLTPTLLNAARLTMSTYLAAGPDGELAAPRTAIYLPAPTRILARSNADADRAMIRAATLMFPSQPILWVAAARGPVDQELIAAATSILENPEQRVGLRAAAGLVVGTRDADVYSQIVDWIVAYLNEFAAAPRRPLRTPGSGWMWDYEQDGELLIVLRDLPQAKLDGMWDALLKRRYNEPGKSTLCILAKRDPRRLALTLLGQKDLIPNEEATTALALCIYIQPDLRELTSAQYSLELIQPELDWMAKFGEVWASDAPSRVLWE